MKFTKSKILKKYFSNRYTNVSEEVVDLILKETPKLPKCISSYHKYQSGRLYLNTASNEVCSLYVDEHYITTKFIA
jgi:hypothetical protein